MVDPSKMAANAVPRQTIQSLLEQRWSSAQISWHLATEHPDEPAHRGTLAAGTRVWRVHSSRRSALAPNPTAQPDELSGGRFDSLDGCVRLPVHR